ncbi:hypothetical protein [Archangium sp.]|uniref:hypothetical protein n=1 Tax=Archangium sp. TaxID=1872627 RepID=UPI002D6BFFBC|nr:hypothetical protein [Archangium sp.]HYO54526.1 hypothetical protein [Archangium sp.]
MLAVGDKPRKIKAELDKGENVILNLEYGESEYAARPGTPGCGRCTRAGAQVPNPVVPVSDSSEKGMNMDTEFADKLERHALWIDSGGKQGE